MEKDRFELGRERQIAKRAELWEAERKEKEISKFSLRIQKQIKSIEIPPIKEVCSSYLWGSIGTGKTIKSVFMILEYVREGYVYFEHSCDYIFITVPELLLQFKSTYNKPKQYADDDIVTEIDLVNKFSDVDLLVLDDFGVEKTTDWSFQLLYIILNRRYENEKMTIITSNFNLEELAIKLGDDRIPSRIQEMCKIIKTGNKNYRE